MKISITAAIAAALLVASNSCVSADVTLRRGGRLLKTSGKGKGKGAAEEIPSSSTKSKKQKSEKGKGATIEDVEEPSKDEVEAGCPEAPPAEPKNCLTEEGVNGIMTAFEGAVVAISNAYWCRGDHANETECGTTVVDGPPPKAACQRAYEIAHGAIDGAYGYADSVLFKPTLTTEPYTYRPTRNGALSYFIGTVCVNLAGLESEQFPDGNGDGSLFQENGFALNAYVGSDGIQRTGWLDLEYDFAKFLYRIDPEGGQNCETAVVQGKMCFVHHNTEIPNTCVDKTFGFNDLTGDGTSPVITTHHSSATIKEDSSLVICQNEGDGKVPTCA